MTGSPLGDMLQIQPVEGPIDLDIAVPGSKSITNRALVLGALANGEVTLTDALFADDTGHMMNALTRLGFEVEGNEAARTIQIKGLGGEIPAREAELFVGSAGTVMRFLTALVCLGKGRFTLTGSERMCERPIADLVDGLRGLGVNVGYAKREGCPPLVVEADGLPGGKCLIDGSRSSQYISALLMVAPYAKSSLEIEVTGDFVSRPYVNLTLRTMSEMGIGTNYEGVRLFHPTHGARYRTGSYQVEGDATAASYFLAAAAILGGRCAVTNIRSDSPQGDVGFAKVLARMGCTVHLGFLDGNRGIEVARDPRQPLKPINIGLNAMPDVAQTLAAVCLYAKGTSTMVNIGNLRIKETDRLSALKNELTRLGAKVTEGPESLEITPDKARDAEVETYDDHRMAMAMALVGLGRTGVTIKDPGCVSKTYPNYFEDLDRLRG